MNALWCWMVCFGKSKSNELKEKKTSGIELKDEPSEIMKKKLKKEKFLCSGYDRNFFFLVELMDK